MNAMTPQEIQAYFEQRFEETKKQAPHPYLGSVDTPDENAAVPEPESQEKSHAGEEPQGEEG